MIGSTCRRGRQETPKPAQTSLRSAFDSHFPPVQPRSRQRRATLPGVRPSAVFPLLQANSDMTISKTVLGSAMLFIMVFLLAQAQAQSGHRQPVPIAFCASLLLCQSTLLARIPQALWIDCCPTSEMASESELIWNEGPRFRPTRGIMFLVRRQPLSPDGYRLGRRERPFEKGNCNATKGCFFFGCRPVLVQDFMTLFANSNRAFPACIRGVRSDQSSRSTPSLAVSMGVKSPQTLSLQHCWLQKGEVPARFRCFIRNR